MAPCLLQAAFLQGMHNFLGPPQASSRESPDSPVSMTVWGIWEQSRCSGDKRRVTVVDVLGEESMWGSAAAGRGLLCLPCSQRMLRLCPAVPADQGYVDPFPFMAWVSGTDPRDQVCPCRCFPASSALGCRDALAAPGAAFPCQCLKGCS